VPIEPVTFEPRRFSSAAAHYLAGRVAYAPRLIARVAECCRLTATDRVLDLGCGPGQLAKAFAPLVAEVIGIDPEPEMLRLAEQDAPANVSFREGSSYGIGPDLGTCQLVTMGRSFHWMDRVDTLRRLDGIIAPGGAVALFHDHNLDLPENAWRKDFRELLGRYAANDPGWGTRHGPEWVRHETILLDSAFCELEAISIIERRQISATILVERALSMSSTSRARLGDRADAMVADIRALARGISAADRLVEVVAGTALIATRRQ
jgi:trans-aconitate methyltransferase